VLRPVQQAMANNCDMARDWATNWAGGGWFHGIYIYLWRYINHL
jgi:hypothetical protein